jgi:hypothetical protein
MEVEEVEDEMMEDDFDEAIDETEAEENTTYPYEHPQLCPQVAWLRDADWLQP